MMPTLKWKNKLDPSVDQDMLNAFAMMEKLGVKLSKSTISSAVGLDWQDELESMYGEKGEIAWGNQIRSYVLQPYQMVKDLRTEYKTSSPDDVLDGGLMPFMEAYLRRRLAQGPDAK